MSIPIDLFAGVVARTGEWITLVPSRRQRFIDMTHDCWPDRSAIVGRELSAPGGVIAGGSARKAVGMYCIGVGGLVLAGRRDERGRATIYGW